MSTKNKIILYNPKSFNGEILKFPGMEKFCHLFKMFSLELVSIDRSGTIKFPIRTEILSPLPEFKIMKKTFSEICSERAKQLIEKIDDNNQKIYVFYSGGIDSTLVLVSLLKVVNEEQKKRIVVLMSEESVKENPVFFERHINNKLCVENISIFPDLIGVDDVFVSGENSEDLFCINIFTEFRRLYGISKLNENYSRETIIDFFNSRNEKEEYNIFWVDLIERVCSKSPIKLKTFLHYFWWIGFCFRWQTCQYKFIMFVKEKNKAKVNHKYMKENFITFFDTIDFQLWSMNNLDLKIKDTWKSYKYLAKDIIYEFDGNEEYWKNKIKVPSYRISNNGEMFNFLDSEFNFYKDFPGEEFLEPNNDFI